MSVSVRVCVVFIFLVAAFTFLCIPVNYFNHSMWLAPLIAVAFKLEKSS